MRKSKRIWFDGLGNKMKRGTYSENEVSFAKNGCFHDCEKKIIEVFFFCGGYYHKMRKCKICGGLVSADMVNHPVGHHRFEVPQKEGFFKCIDCDLSINPQPVTTFSSPVY